MTINVEKITTLTGVAKEAIGSLNAYKNQSKDELLKNSEKLGNIKYQFIVAIEACIDICNHITSKQFSRAPESYAHFFSLLGEQNVITNDLAKHMADLAKFRNVLVHLYWKVDNSRVIDIMKEDSFVLNDYLTIISSYVEEYNSD